jgi:hypothetical protein
MRHFTNVAGVTFPNEDGASRQNVLERCQKGMPCRLEAEPTNKYDPNAIKVMVATAPGKVEQVGYIPRNLAAIIAPSLQGESIMVEIIDITGGFETRNGKASYGMNIAITLPDAPAEDEQANGGPVYDHKSNRGDSCRDHLV